MRVNFKILLWILLVLTLAACSSSKGLEVKDAWARPGMSGDNSAIYFTISNPGAEDDVLQSAECDVATQAELHMSSMDASGTMSMLPQESVAIPAGGQVEFKPAGLHVMLVGLKQNLKEGDTFKVTLNFEKTGAITLEVVVKQQS